MYDRVSGVLSSAFMGVLVETRSLGFPGARHLRALRLRGARPHQRGGAAHPPALGPSGSSEAQLIWKTSQFKKARNQM